MCVARACNKSFAFQVSSRVWRGYLCNALHVFVEAKGEVGTMLVAAVVHALARVLFREGQGVSQHVELRDVAQILQKRFNCPAQSRQVLTTASKFDGNYNVREVFVVGMPEVFIYKRCRARSIQQPYEALAVSVTVGSSHQLHNLMRVVLQLL